MTPSPVADRSNTNVSHEGNVVLVNIFTPKPGQLDAFITAQIGEYVRLKGKVRGWLGNHLHRAVDGSTAVNIAVFDSIENYRAWRDGVMFADHLEVIKPFIERAEPGLYGPALYDAKS